MVLIPVLLLLAAAQEDLTVLEAGPGGPPSKMLDRYLQGETAKLFEERRKTVGAINTPEEFRRRQEDLRARFVAALGGYPERTPLNPRTVGKGDRAGCRVERVIYESRPGHHVTAVLYLPEGTPPFPGVLFPCGHSDNGKAAEAYQRACILLARNGMAVLCYDPIGQGERRQILAGPPGKQNIGNTTEHTLAGVGALLVGRCAASYRIWDGLRSMDYLASRPEVDPSRLGCTGNSGGGTMTAYLMALDDRIRCAAPSCYITSLERLFATIGPQDAEQNIPGQVAFGMEHADYVTMRAPKPTRICIATRDFFDREGALTTFGEAKRLYGVMGKAECVDLFEFNDTHGFSKPRREAAMRWMRRWLLEKDDEPAEPDFPVAKDVEMQCTETGQVLRDLKGKSVFDLNAERARELAASRPAKDLPGEVRRRIGFRPPAVGLRPESRGEIRRGDVLLEKLVYRTEPGIAVPAVRLKAGAAGKTPVIYVSGEGKGVAARQEGPAEVLAKAGRVVLVPDLRGWGETAPEDKGGKRRLVGADCNEAFLGLHLSRPLLGQRVYDLLCLVESLGGEIEVVGEGAAGPVVLHAALLDPRIRKLTIDGSILSWSAVVESPIGYGQLANAVPGALESYDLPDLAAALAPRPLEIRSPASPMGAPVPRETFAAAYAVCRAAYERAGAGDRFTAPR